MVIHELTAGQCHEVLGRTTLGRLACARYDQPYIVPILFYFDSETTALYSFATLGQKVRWMRENPKVCVEVEEISDRFHWTSVVVFGRYEELLESDAKEARQRAQALFEQHPEWWLPAAGKLTSGSEHHSAVVYRIKIDRLSGRRAARDSM